MAVRAAPAILAERPGTSQVIENGPSGPAGAEILPPAAPLKVPALPARSPSLAPAVASELVDSPAGMAAGSLVAMPAGGGAPPTTPLRSRHRRWLAATLAALITAGCFGLAYPRIASYGQVWRSVVTMTWPGMLLVAVAAVGSLAATWIMIRAFLPRLRLREAAAVSLGASAVANTVPAGGAVALGLTWRMLASWGIGTQEFVRYTLVSGLWNVFARFGLPVIALLALAVSGRSSGVPLPAACGGAAALLVVAAGFRALLRSQRLALRAGRGLQRVVTLGCRFARRHPPRQIADSVLTVRADISRLVSERGIRITSTTVLANLSPWLVLLACLRASGLTQAQVSWQASLAAFAMIRLLTVLPVTPGGFGVVELGLTASLAAGLGNRPSAHVAAAVLLFRAMTYLPSLPLGAFACLWWRRLRRKPSHQVNGQPWSIPWTRSRTASQESAG